MRYLLLPLLAVLLFAACEDEEGLFVDETPLPSEPVIVVEPPDVPTADLRFGMKLPGHSEPRVTRGSAVENEPGVFVVSSLDSLVCLDGGGVGGHDISVQDTFMILNFTVAEDGTASLSFVVPVFLQYFDSNSPNGLVLGEVLEQGDTFCDPDEFKLEVDLSNPGFVSGELNIRLYDVLRLPDGPSTSGDCDEFPEADLGEFNIFFNVPLRERCG